MCFTGGLEYFLCPTPTHGCRCCIFFAKLFAESKLVFVLYEALHLTAAVFVKFTAQTRNGTIKTTTLN